VARVRDERLKRGWSLTHLSGLTGIASSDLSMVERGLRPAFPGWQRRLARAFHLPMGVLFEAERARRANPEQAGPGPPPGRRVKGSEVRQRDDGTLSGTLKQ
jgi:transcriptional regulator with XRE-family HTH domain